MSDVRPALTVMFDSHTQAVSVKVDKDQIKNYEFAVCVLDMAKKSVEQTIRLNHVEAMQRLAVEAAAQKKILQKLHT